jgi:CBS domain-containing protein
MYTRILVVMDRAEEGERLSSWIRRLAGLSRARVRLLALRPPQRGVVDGSRRWWRRSPARHPRRRRPAGDAGGWTMPAMDLTSGRTAPPPGRRPSGWPNEWEERMRIKTIMRGPVVAIEVGTPLSEAAALMRRSGVSHLPVVAGARLCGILSRRDVAEASPSSLPSLARYDWLPRGFDEVPAETVMQRAATLPADATVTEAARRARTERVDALVVVEGEEVVGIVTRADLLGAAAALLDATPRFASIVVAVSLRDSSAATVAEAARLAAETGAQLTAVHVLPSWSALGAEAVEGDLPPAIVNRLRRGAALDALSVLVAQAGARATRCDVVTGHVATQVADRARAHDADVVVVGRHRGTRRWPVAGAALAALATCPVLILPAKDGRAGR